MSDIPPYANVDEQTLIDTFPPCPVCDGPADVVTDRAGSLRMAQAVCRGCGYRKETAGIDGYPAARFLLVNLRMAWEGRPHQRPYRPRPPAPRRLSQDHRRGRQDTPGGPPRRLHPLALVHR